MIVDLEKCIGCGYCVRDCPVGAVRLIKKKAVIQENCTECGACIKVCEQGALRKDPAPAPGAVICDACPIACQVKEGFTGACHRYRNVGGRLVRVTPLHSFEKVENIVGPEPLEIIRKPIVTGIGAGTTYPDCKTAPAIVESNRSNVDVVTVVTEAPLSYSSILVKIDTDVPVGEEGADVLAGKRKVGIVITEQYGSKMLSIGGVNLLTGKDGLVVARTIADIANRKPVKLSVKEGSKLELQVGETPVINGERPASMRVGCGSATMGLFAPHCREAADEVIIVDSHLTGLMSEHAAGRFVGAQPSGVNLAFRMSTPGRYFGDHGNGWGGTSITDPLGLVSSVDMTVARPGMTIFVTETTGRNGALYQVDSDGGLNEIPLTDKCENLLGAIRAACEPSRVSAVYMGGTGGSARAGVTLYPIKLTEAVHGSKAVLTAGGSPVYVLPGGGINFMVDVERVKTGAFYWTPTPATICPVEYTMTKKDYEEMGGHMEAIKPFRPTGGDAPE